MCILYESEMLSEVNTFILFIYYIKKKKFFYHKSDSSDLSTCPQISSYLWHQLTCGSLFDLLVYMTLIKVFYGWTLWCPCGFPWLSDIPFKFHPVCWVSQQTVNVFMTIWSSAHASGTRDFFLLPWKLHETKGTTRGGEWVEWVLYTATVRPVTRHRKKPTQNSFLERWY